MKPQGPYTHRACSENNFILCYFPYVYLTGSLQMHSNWTNQYLWSLANDSFLRWIQHCISPLFSRNEDSKTNSLVCCCFRTTLTVSFIRQSSTLLYLRCRSFRLSAAAISRNKLAQPNLTQAVTLNWYQTQDLIICY